uniref:Uncharacterized protein n=1 Tax=Cacopsylla melanoneura TaxID=428564 RepID=A0A8D9AA54_9HEMI
MFVSSDLFSFSTLDSVHSIPFTKILSLLNITNFPSFLNSIIFGISFLRFSMVSFVWSSSTNNFRPFNIFLLLRISIFLHSVVNFISTGLPGNLWFRFPSRQQ